MPNARVQNSLPRARSASLAVNVRNTHATYTATTSSGGATVGAPIGLLLTLTYAASGATIPGGASDYKPNIRIR